MAVYLERTWSITVPGFVGEQPKPYKWVGPAARLREARALLCPRLLGLHPPEQQGLANECCACGSGGGAAADALAAASKLGPLPTSMLCMQQTSHMYENAQMSITRTLLSCVPLQAARGEPAAQAAAAGCQADTDRDGGCGCSSSRGGSRGRRHRECQGMIWAGFLGNLLML